MKKVLTVTMDGILQVVFATFYGNEILLVMNVKLQIFQEHQ
ncbi:hypothetical protein WF787_08810 [Faecalibacterium sp. HTF-76H]|uniref:Transcriptional regulator n=1 Tax=Faecalibacterium taiwanense TaxID=3030638 RepID=A0AB35XY10_9FIRM